MELVLDLHLHSKYSRAVSPKMNLHNMYKWARKKGINILSVSDFTHPLWFREVQSQLDEESVGIYKLKDETSVQKELEDLLKFPFTGPYFLLATEVASIYSERGEGHRIHNLILAPNFSVVQKINEEFRKHGFNLAADGRPMLGITSRNLLELLLPIDKNIMLIPCHAWTPWFSLYGSRSGYDSIEDCFGEYSKYIYAIETGLSSDPSMNWRIKELENRSIVSFSDAHSLEKMGREATILKFRIQNLEFRIGNLTYQDIVSAFKREEKRKLEIAYTIEFYPEEGKYHYTGHRACGISYSPAETRQKGVICPVCRKPLTVGVMHRVDELAKGIQNSEFRIQNNEFDVKWVVDSKGLRPPYVSLVPLFEVLSEVHGSTEGSNIVLSSYNSLVSSFGSEIAVLLKAPIREIEKIAGGKVAEGIKRVRTRDVSITPGFDGEYGKVNIQRSAEVVNGQEKKVEQTQLGLGF